MAALLRYSVILLTLVILAKVAEAQRQATGRSYWEQTAKEELEASLSRVLNKGLAKNVIIFVGDGMGPTTITTARIFNGGEESFLSWEKFPHVGVLKTYCEDKTVPDSGSTATSMFCGVKTNYNVIGVSSAVMLNDCNATMKDGAKLTHLTTLAQAVGKSTGIVTTARVTHATPSALYAHSANRIWECDVPKDATACKDIGRQLVEDLPGKNINVILGGGQYMLQTNVTAEPDPVDDYCQRQDGRDLISDWAKDKSSRNLTYAVVNNTKSLLTVDTKNTDYLLGIFAKNHLKFHYERDTTDQGTPSLEEMTLAALKILMKNEKGFFLMVEAEHVDLAHHLGRAKKAIYEVLALNDAINSTMKVLKDAGILDDTLVIVTSDHSHTLTISGYPNRGNNILGIASVGLDNVPYTTLSYANGKLSNYHYKVSGDKVVRDDPSKVDTTDFEYGQQVAVLMPKNTHGGHDVMIYASGPYAHLFHHLHEQNYVYSVVKYAAQLGEFSKTVSFSRSIHTSVSCVLLISGFFITKLL